MHRNAESADSASLRARQRLAWARDTLALPTLELTRASADAGFRSYWRTCGAAPSRIVMDSPPDREDVRPWLAMHELLTAGGVRVPIVLASDSEAGLLLLEDLGVATCLEVIDQDNADALFDAAITQLLKLQAITPPADLPRYDQALLTRELRLFDEWFLGRHLGLTLEREDLEHLLMGYRHLVESALAQPQVLVHRDFMPRNLMPIKNTSINSPIDSLPIESTPVDGSLVKGKPVDSMHASLDPSDTTMAVLDFQDAVRGPIAYDPICLFKDAFVSWPTTRVDAWLDHYHARALTAGLSVPAREVFRRDADWIGVHRHLKVIGIFARLHHRDGKSQYLADVPRFFAYLDDVLPRYPELAPLWELFERTVKPALRHTGGSTAS